MEGKCSGADERVPSQEAVREYDFGDRNSDQQAIKAVSGDVQLEARQKKDHGSLHQ